MLDSQGGGVAFSALISGVCAGVTVSDCSSLVELESSDFGGILLCNVAVAVFRFACGFNLINFFDCYPRLRDSTNDKRKIPKPLLQCG